MGMAEWHVFTEEDSGFFKLSSFLRYRKECFESFRKIQDVNDGSSTKIENTVCKQ